MLNCLTVTRNAWGADGSMRQESWWPFTASQLRIHCGKRRFPAPLPPWLTCDYIKSDI